MTAAATTPNDARTLVERLGFDVGARLVMLNCDDFGSMHGANVSTIAALDSGAATSATLMAPCPWAAEAASMVEAHHEIGVHLTLTSEWAGYRWAPLTGARSLCAGDGRMHRTVDECHAAVIAAGAAGFAELRAECVAQIEQALAWGVDVTHLDAHMATMQTHPAFVELYVELADAYRLPARMMPASQERRAGLDARSQAAERGVLHPDHLFMTYLDARPAIEHALTTLRPGITEFLVHPSLDSDELRAACFDADERVANHEFLCGPRSFAEQAAALGATMIGFRALRDLQRGASTVG